MGVNPLLKQDETWNVKPRVLSIKQKDSIRMIIDFSSYLNLWYFGKHVVYIVYTFMSFYSTKRFTNLYT